MVQFLSQSPYISFISNQNNTCQKWTGLCYAWSDTSAKGLDNDALSLRSKCHILLSTLDQCNICALCLGLTYHFKALSLESVQHLCALSKIKVSYSGSLPRISITSVHYTQGQLLTPNLYRLSSRTDSTLYPCMTASRGK